MGKKVLQGAHGTPRVGADGRWLRLGLLERIGLFDRRRLLGLGLGLGRLHLGIGLDCHRFVLWRQEAVLTSSLTAIRGAT
jgi:hypothetical protein